MSHINSVKRDRINKKSPYEMTKFTWGKNILEALHIRKIDPDKVTLNKTILKIKVKVGRNGNLLLHSSNLIQYKILTYLYNTTSFLFLVLYFTISF